MKLVLEYDPVTGYVTTTDGTNYYLDTGLDSRHPELVYEEKLTTASVDLEYVMKMVAVAQQPELIRGLIK